MTVSVPSKAPLVESELPSISPALTVVDALPLMADEEGIFTIPRKFQSQALSVVIPHAWDNYRDNYFPGATLTFQIWMISGSGIEVQNQVVPDRTVEMPEDPTQLFPLLFEREFAIPERFLRSEGVFRLFYKVWVTQDGNVSKSESVEVFLDKTAPHEGQSGRRPVLKNPAVIIDDQYLANNNNELVVQVPRWDGFHLEDQAELCMEPTAAQPVEPIVPVVTVRETFDDFLEISIPAAALRRRANGREFLYYSLIDRAGNRGWFSYALEINLQLGASFNLPLPVVPLASDGVINRTEATSNHVTVEIRRIPELQPFDQLHAFWNGRPLPVVTIEQTTTWPVSIPVSQAEIFKDGDGRVFPCTVDYLVVQGGRSQRSGPTDFTVDLRQAQAALRPVTFPAVNLWGWIGSLQRPWNGIKIKVPGNRGLWFAGESVEVFFEVRRNPTDQSNGDPAKDPVLVDKRLLTTFLLRNEDLDGFETELPANLFEPWLATPLESAGLEDGKEFMCRAIVTYMMAGQVGRASTSADLKIDLQRPGGGMYRGD